MSQTVNEQTVVADQQETVGPADALLRYCNVHATGKTTL